MDYKFGIKVYKYINGYNKTVGVCSCGQCIPSYLTKFQCDKCGNELFVNARNQSNKRFVIPYLEASRKDNRGFKVKRTNLSVIYDEENTTVSPIKENINREMEYDIVDSILKVWRNGVLEYDSSVDGMRKMDDANRMFFTQVEANLFLDFVSNEVTRGLYDVVNRLSDNGWNKKKHILRGLKRLSTDYKWLQILANAGIPNVNRFYQNRYSYYGGYREDSVINKDATKPHEILKVPKFFMPYIREDVSIDRDVLHNLQSHFKNLDINKFKEIMSIVKDEGSMKQLSNSIETIMQIHIDYGYTNLKKLVLYLFREVRLTQGIESPQNASTYLRDYIRMSRHMELEWEKYPKSLKKEHDVVQMNYNMLNANDKKIKLFKSSIEKKSYQSLQFGLKDKKQKYAILIPNSPEDLIKEGNQLSHCVASYVSDVNNDKCKILFLRDKEDLEKPLATIEVRGLNIRQARGFANRAIPEDQKEFIRAWAEKNNLVEAYY